MAQTATVPIHSQTHALQLLFLTSNRWKYYLWTPCPPSHACQGFAPSLGIPVGNRPQVSSALMTQEPSIPSRPSPRRLFPVESSNHSRERLRDINLWSSPQKNPPSGTWSVESCTVLLLNVSENQESPDLRAKCQM